MPDRGQDVARRGATLQKVGTRPYQTPDGRLSGFRDRAPTNARLRSHRHAAVRISGTISAARLDADRAGARLLLPRAGANRRVARLLLPRTDADRWVARLILLGTESARGETRLIFTSPSRAAGEARLTSGFLRLSQPRSRHLAQVLTLVSAELRRPQAHRTAARPGDFDGTLGLNRGEVTTPQARAARKPRRASRTKSGRRPLVSRPKTSNGAPERGRTERPALSQEGHLSSRSRPPHRSAGGGLGGGKRLSRSRPCRTYRGAVLVAEPSAGQGVEVCSVQARSVPPVAESRGHRGNRGRFRFEGAGFRLFDHPPEARKGPGT